MGREFVVEVLRGVDVDDERFHVTASLLLGQRMILHVLTGIGGAVGETDAALALTVLSTADHRTQGIAVVHEGSQTHTQSTGDLDQRTQRRQVLVVLDTVNLLYRQTAALCNLLNGEVLGLSDPFDLVSDN